MIAMTVATSGGNESLERKARLRLGAINGCLIGVALALGVWGPEFITLVRLPAPLPFSGLLAGGLLLAGLGALAGGLAALQEKGWWSLIAWFVAGLVMIWVIGHMPYEGQDWLLWLTDGRFRGLNIYAFGPPERVRMGMAGFFILVLLAIIGLLQPFRLESIRAANDTPTHLSGKAWFLLLVPLPLVFAAGIVADNLVNQPFRAAPAMVAEVIDVGRVYEDNLFQLSRDSGTNYNAISGFRAQMSGRYELKIAELDLTAAQAVVVSAHFDNGFWMNCRVVTDPSIAQVTFCYDAGDPYFKGFPALITGESVEDCLSCTVRASDRERSWLRQYGDAWAGAPVITFIAQEGSFVLMRAASPDGNQSVECLFNGLSPVTLHSCREVET
ncbi:MAG: hypothetical protein J5I90_00365 [Caldilineales bacterium]|nr:hypothetical protein [Caldilineales bacterium]